MEHHCPPTLLQRDDFYTNAMKDLTQFANATKYFLLRRNSRLLHFAFTYHLVKRSKPAGGQVEAPGKKWKEWGVGDSHVRSVKCFAAGI